MQRSASLFVLFASLTWLDLAIAQQPAKSPYVLKVVTDKPEAVYAKGDTAAFSITLTKDGQAVDDAEFKYTLSLDGYQTLAEGTHSGKKTTFTGTLDQPGVLRSQVEFKVDDKPIIRSFAAAVYDPLDIKPSLPVPDDFDAFWNEQKKLLAEVPMKSRLTPVKSPVAEVECFDAQIDCMGGKPVSGYFARPVNAKPKTLPAVLYVHGAGVRSSSLNSAYNEAKRGRLGMDINAHGIPNGEPDEFYTALANGELKDYRFEGRTNRDTCYFRGMFLRLIRAIDFLCAQPEWDGQIVIVRGASQGGGQALAAAGLDQRVTAIYAGVPAICDHSGNAASRIAGWPKLVPLTSDKKPDPEVLQVARYFDGMNFATRTKADAILTVGFIDAVCPPTSVYAAYNNLQGKKTIITGPLNAHEGPSAGKAIDDFLDDHVKRVKSK